MRFRWYLITAVALLGPSLRAQVVDLDRIYDEHDPAQVVAHIAAEDRVKRLVSNSEQLAYTLTVDRNTPYFPGELIKLEIAITNPTSSPLEIPDPNDPLVHCFKGGVEDACHVPLAVKSTIIQPGQVITVIIDGEDKESAKRWNLEWVSPMPGKCSRRYLLGGRVEYEVGKPILEASALVPLQVFKTYQWKGMKEPRTVQKAAMIVAVQLNGEHLLFVGQDNVNTTYKVKPEKDGTFSDASMCAPWVRLDTSSSAITSLKGTADDKGRITIQYAAADGAPHALFLDETRHPAR
ncbi:MAG: hypothetical protein ABSG25_03210 [Bryobacteraceae bacterium]